AGGPYAIQEGQSLTLSGAASSDGDALTFSWDVNGDGIFGDATGVSPTLTWAQLQALGITDGPSQFQVRVRVEGCCTADSPAVTLTVINVAPSIAISGASNVNEGSSYSLTLGAVTDPGTDTVTSYVV